MALADLRLPPSFVTDHCIRTLSYQGAMNASELARHWRVHDNIAMEVVASLKATGLVEPESSQTTFDRAHRVRLSATGQQRIAAARERTWYSGALPVSLAEFEHRAERDGGLAVEKSALEQALGAMEIDDGVAAEVGQALNAGATVALGGLAFDEQVPMASALEGAIAGEMSLPSALYAAGAVIRVFNPRYHRVARAEPAPGASVDIMRSHDVPTQWVRIGRPAVVLAGGVQPSDVIPAFDEEARLYVAPLPFCANEGVLVVLDADTNPAGLAALARCWLVSGRYGSGLMLLRSGERIEVPWRASTVLLGASVPALPASLGAAIPCVMNISHLAEESLRRALRSRLADPAVFPDDAIEALAAELERHRMAARAAVARAAYYMANRAAYEGTDFNASTAPAAAIEFVTSAPVAGPALLHPAA
jgi:DNA-binding MarR family transcriptional regulator